MKRLIVFLSIIILLICSILFIPKPKTNFDMTSYLPENSMTRRGLSIIEEQFGIESTIQILIYDVDVNDLISLKLEIYDINHVNQVIWLDDYVDLELIPIEYLDPEVTSPFYQNGDALITIVFDVDAHDVTLKNSILSISLILNDYDVMMRGQAIDNIHSRGVAETEIIKVMILIIPVILLILILVSKTWIEPVLILINLGIAILFNVLTNGFLGEVSYITQTLAIALQLALSIDYSLILIHRYYEERKTYDAKSSAFIALKKTMKSISGSAFTTIIGFSVLMIMNYKIGLDIGLVLSKGILFSYLSTIFVLPILLSWSNQLMEKSNHRSLLPKLKLPYQFLFKRKFLYLSIFIFLIVLGAFFQTRADFFYGSSALSKAQEDDKEIINQRFGPYMPIILLTENTSLENELFILETLYQYDEILSVTALITVTDPYIPRQMLPEPLLNSFIGETHTRWIIYTNLSEENEMTFEFINRLKHDFDDNNTYIVSELSAIYEIRESIINQEVWITMIAILSVMLVIGLLFKSLIIPIVLVSVIQAAIWINISFVYFMDIKVQYIGYLVVMSIQLGATIDYAILLTSRYIEYRKQNSKDDAIKLAYENSVSTILISGMILAIAGFIEGLFSEIGTVTDIGFLLGRGAIISSIMVLIFLPSLLKIIDPLIFKNKT
jgi:uncharacterized protein